MMIQSVDIYTLDVPLLKPFKIAIGVRESIKNIVIKIVTDTGLVGWGEASPSAYIIGDTAETAYQAAQAIAQQVLGKNPLAIENRMTEIKRFMIGQSSIRCAFDFALYDIAAKAARMPLYQFLGGELVTPDGRPRVLRTDNTIGLQDSVEDTLAEAQKILDQHFNAIKMKVGRPGLQDVAHVAAVRALAGPDIAIRVDSNQGWDYPTAVANITAMKPLDVQYSEQALAAWDYDNLARLRNKVDLPICADESLFDDKDALKLVKAGAADYLNIKLGKAGGIHTGIKINAIAEAAGCKCMLGSFGESRLGLSAAAHLAAAKPNIVFLDLDSALMFKTDPVIGGLHYDTDRGGVIHLPEAIGHGASFDETALSNCVTVTG